MSDFIEWFPLAIAAFGLGVLVGGHSADKRNRNDLWGRGLIEIDPKTDKFRWREPFDVTPTVGPGRKTKN